MSIAEARYHLKRLKRKYFALKITEICLWSMASAFIAYGLASLFTSAASTYIIATTVGLALFILAFIRYRLHLLTERKLIAFMDQQHQQLENSTDLLVKESATLTILEQLQQQRVLDQFTLVQKDVKLPNRLATAALAFAGSVLIVFAFSAFDLVRETGTTERSAPSELVKNSPEEVLPVAVRALTVAIQPPAYTGIPAYTTAAPQLSVPEGSEIQWIIAFTDSVSEAALIFSAKEPVTLQSHGGTKTVTRKFTVPAFYQIRWTDHSGKTRLSDYYKIEVIRDQAPEVAITNLEQSLELSIKDKLVIDVKSTIKDDYQVTDAYIIATVSKGSGESVKFREEKLKFTSPAHVSGRQLHASRTIDLLKLGLEPGDELYFYAETIDNKQPAPNRSRTETFFITLQDTASQSLSVEGGLGVDLMPEYFRSQRQIIIDTEKLLKEKRKISKHDFNARSNELGYDQKVLRLKYGEFLGEEFETQIGETHAGAEEGEEAEDIAAKYGHTHDKDNEHNLVPDKKHADDHGHAHEHEGEGEDKTKSLMDAYKHQHDDPEEATFFNQSIRARLKAALTIMWDAELYLRLYEPEKSLPYQYRALKILKEVSNDSRIYVHKTGFDPPPLKEEKRLTGDLSEIKSSRHHASFRINRSYPAIRKGLQLIEEKLQQKPVKFSGGEKQTLHEAGREIAGIALEKPGQFLESLSMIKTLEENEITQENMQRTLMGIRRAFWQVLPDEKVTASQHDLTTHQLDRAFIKNLEALKND